MRFTRNTLYRVLRTFLQTFVPAIVVGLKTVDFTQDKAALKVALIGIVIPAAAAGLAALMNLEPTVPTDEGELYDE
jgi:hypothetical protein